MAPVALFVLCSPSNPPRIGSGAAAGGHVFIRTCKHLWCIGGGP
jgi:hypothetical protein